MSHNAIAARTNKKRAVATCFLSMAYLPFGENLSVPWRLGNYVAITRRVLIILLSGTI